MDATQEERVREECDGVCVKRQCKPQQLREKDACEKERDVSFTGLMEKVAWMVGGGRECAYEYECR